MKTKYIKFIFIGSFIITLITPIFIDRFIISNNFPSNITNDQWIGFFGNYLGGIFGGLATLYAFVKSIEYNREKDIQADIRYSEDKRLNMLPFLQIMFDDKWQDTNRLLEISEKTLDNNASRMNRGVIIKNIGLGSLIDVSFEFEDLNITSSNFNLHLSLSKDQEFTFNLILYKNYNEMKETKILIKYEDLLGNKYGQELVLSINADNGVLYIKNITKPVLL